MCFIFRLIYGDVLVFLLLEERAIYLAVKQYELIKTAITSVC